MAGSLCYGKCHGSQELSSFAGRAMKDKLKSDPDNNLCQPLEDLLKNGRSNPASSEESASADVLALVHEVQANQIELQMQNEELKRTKLEMNDALAKYSDLYDFAPIGLFTLDENRHILEVNIAGAELLGVKRADLLNRPFELFVAKDDRLSFISFCKSAFETSARQICELSFLRDKVPTLYARIEGMVTGGHMPDERQFRIAVMDITERKRAEDSLRLNEEKFRLAFENAFVGIAQTDADKRIMQINQEFCRMLGYTKEELLGRCIFDLVHPDDLSACIAYSDRIKNGEITKLSNKKRYLRGDGTSIWADVTVSVVHEGKSKSEFHSVVARDITQQKMAEEALQESERRFRDAIDNFPNVFVIYDEDRRVRFVNSKGLQIIGLSEQDVLGRKDEEIFPPEMVNSYLPALLRAVETKNPQTLERTRPKSMGRQVIMINIIPLLDEHGSVRRILGISHDITERKRAEDALRMARDELELRVEERTAELVKINEDLTKAKEAAEAAAVAKSQFLATMSHELRTPLNAVIGMTSLLLNEGLPPEQMESIEIIRASGEDLLALINKVLDFSKMEKGKMELERQPFELRRCIEDSVHLLSGEASNRNLKLACLIDGNVPDIIISDQMRLRQILGNLLSNAVKFTDNGEITISVSSRQKMWDLYEFHFSVRDTGIGIPPDMMHKLFKPFSQVDASNTRKYGGTGLGLAICKNIVEMMSGRIWAESQPGRGSTFHFTILAQAISNGNFDIQGSDTQNSDAQKPFFRRDDYPGKDLEKNLRILLAEDNLLNQTVTMRMLGKLGYSADAVADGREAISALERQHYDVVLMDMQMPEMDGLEATRIIRKSFGIAKQPKIIALTAHALEGDREQCIESGMDDYIAKPVNIEELKAALQRCRQFADREP